MLAKWQSSTSERQQRQLPVQILGRLVLEASGIEPLSPAFSCGDGGNEHDAGNVVDKNYDAFPSLSQLEHLLELDKHQQEKKQPNKRGLLRTDQKINNHAKNYQQKMSSEPNQVALFAEYGPFGIETKPLFYSALANFLCEAFLPGSIIHNDDEEAIEDSSILNISSNSNKSNVSRTSSKSGLADKNNENEDSTTSKNDLEYSMPKHNVAVRCVRILNAMCEMTTDVTGTGVNSDDENDSSFFSVSHVIHLQLPQKNCSFLKCFMQMLSSLPTLENEMQLYQRRLKASLICEAKQNGVSSYGSSFAEIMFKSTDFTNRITEEFDAHVDIVALQLLPTIYRSSNYKGRKYIRGQIGSFLQSFVTRASMSNVVNGRSGFGAAKVTSAVGVKEILSSVLPIISGFQSPPTAANSSLRSSHVSLLFDVLLPLHKPNGMVLWRDQTPILALYHEKLVICISHILGKAKDEKTSLLVKVIKSLISPDVWPDGRNSNTPKLVLLLHEIDALLQQYGKDHNDNSTPTHDKNNYFKNVAMPLILRLCECIQGDNSRSSERALQLWKCDFFDRMIVAANLPMVIRPLIKALCRVESCGGMQPSWNPTVNKMSALVLNKIEKHDPDLFVVVANELFGETSGGPTEKQSLSTDLIEHEFNSNDHNDSTLSNNNEKISATDNNSLVAGHLLSSSSNFSLKSSLNGWKPLPQQKTRNSSSLKTGNVPNSRKNPPLGVTGVAPWAMNRSTSGITTKPHLTRSSLARKPPQPSASLLPPLKKRLNGSGLPTLLSGRLPPSKNYDSVNSGKDKQPTHQTKNIHDTKSRVTLKQEQQPERITAKRCGQEKNTSIDTNNDWCEKNKSEHLNNNNKKNGIDFVREYMNKLSPLQANHKSDCVEEEKSDENSINSWVAAQHMESPVLLPNLKFHDLVFGQVLGTGAFSTVKYARHIIKKKTRSYWPEYAVKIISTQKIQELGYEKSVNREITILRSLSHPSTTRLIASFRFRHTGAYLVLEYASRGDLYDLIRQKGSLDLESTKFVNGEVVAALHSIHEMGFVFADLKPENVLITESGHVKLGDFGACRAVTKEAKTILKQAETINVIQNLRDGDWRESASKKTGASQFDDEINLHEAFEDDSAEEKALLGEEIDSDDEEDDERIEGTLAYLPPEVVGGGYPTFSADAWALGCVLYQCIAGRPPLLDDTDDLTRTKIVTFQIQPHDESEDETSFFGKSKKFSKDSMSLIRRLLCREALKRPDMVSIAQDAFFEGVEVFTLYKRPAHTLCVGSVAPSVGGADNKWTRRQFSSIWAPQPQEYTLGSVDIKTSSRLGHEYLAKNRPIQEGLEGDAFFLPSSMIRSLGHIGES